jgi:hypothetical protein
VALVVAVLALTVGVSAGAQRRRELHVAELRTVDVIGPRSTASVRAWLARSLPSLAPCQGDVEALVALALAIAPDGRLIRVEPRRDPGADEDATACVVGVVRTWRMTRAAPSVTTVSLALALAPVEAGPDRPAPLEEARCFCFGWVHGDDHGTSCSTTRAACEAEATELGREHTPCRSSRRPACDDDAFIDGRHLRRP